MTIAFRLRAHAKIVSKFIGSDEEIKYLEELYVPHRVVGAVTKAGTMY